MMLSNFNFSLTGWLTHVQINSSYWFFPAKLDYGTKYFCVVNIMYSSQTKSGGPYILQAFKDHSWAQDFQMGFGMDLHLAYIHRATGKAWFFENVIF